MPPAKIMLPGATHEMFLFALDPDHVPEIDKRLHLLTPANFGGQWIAGSDNAAVEYIKSIVSEVCDGALSPDTDFRSMWVERFSDSNMRR